jgi:four helix bundle protein
VNPKAEALKARTKKFALDVLGFLETLPERGTAVRISWQLTDSSTAVASNYRAACRARSKAEFAAKIGTVLEESDESLFWLELCEAKKWGAETLRARLLGEANELTAIFAQSTITARGSMPSPNAGKIPNP